ncbi:DUF4925 domain-containing protein [Butyricimonas paravirosa]|uniref:DUF4925 domain-containing protein n=1 Tax=Butyricimonas paravirosa TaxID=1472417 RepID=UPI00210A5BD9|nr:DUF4925 domain-containing protein [Butyricimonas paravirosa]MCQ4873223.1 DUF4925 domain-containing protein [Butyricimonas paravirosa]
MKNRFLWLLILGMALFASCSDDDDKDPFKNYSADYSADKLDLKLNGMDITGASVAFNSTNKENASVTLKGLIPGESALEIKNLVVTELSGDDYSFIGENKNDDRTVSVEGAVKSGVLSLKTGFKVTSKVVGEWMLAKPETDEYGSILSGGMHIEIVTDIPSIQFPLYGELPINPTEEDDFGFTSLIETLGGGLLPGLLTKINLKEDGNLIASYHQVSGIQDIFDPSKTPLVDSEEGLVRYNVKDGQIYVLVNIASLLGRSTENDPTAGLMTMLETGIPLKLQLEGENMRAYVDREMMLPFMSVLELLKPMIDELELDPSLAAMGITNESLKQLVDDIVNLVTKSSKVELGLNLIPYAEEVEPQASISLPRAIEKTMLEFGE